MNPNIPGLISAILALVAFSITYRFAVKLTMTQKFVWFLIAAILAIPGTTFVIYYSHIIPESALYYQFRSLRGIEFCLIPIGVAGGFLASMLHRVFVVIALFFVTMACFLPFMKPIVAPLGEISEQTIWEDGVCLQSTPATCGPASLATILKKLDIDSTEAQLAREAYTYAGGTEAWYLARAARKRGCKVRFQFSDGFDPTINFPAIVGVKIGGIGHFIAMDRKRDGKFIVEDPLGRRKLSSIDEMNTQYRFTGSYMLISK